MSFEQLAQRALVSLRGAGGEDRVRDLDGPERAGLEGLHGVRT
jgi:hypothetical protein